MIFSWTTLAVFLIVASHAVYAMNDGGIAAPVQWEAAVTPPTQFRGSASPDFAAPSDIKSCGCGRPNAGPDLGFESMSFLQVSCDGVNCACERELQEFEAYCRSKSVTNRPDGRCYFHVANFIDAMGYGGISKNGFNSCVGSQYHKYAYQFHSAIGNGKCGLKNVKDKYDNNPYNAPRGALVVVSAGTPGTAHPVAGDIAVASGDGRFWNGGNMAYGGASYNYKGKLLAIYVPASCEAGSPTKSRGDDISRSEADNAKSSRRSTGDGSPDAETGGLLGRFNKGKSKKRRNSSIRMLRRSVRKTFNTGNGNCQSCIKSGRGRECLSSCPKTSRCQKCIEHAGGKACAPRCL